MFVLEEKGRPHLWPRGKVTELGIVIAPWSFTAPSPT
jgi:hypothetical protein